MSGFNPATNAAVWKEARQQTDSLIDRWLEENSIVPVMKDWTCRLALHVISAVFFRKSLNWNDHKEDSKPGLLGHQTSFEQALFTVLARLGILYVTPRALLKILPMKPFRETQIGFTEWTKYLQELCGETIARKEELAMKGNQSILGM